MVKWHQYLHFIAQCSALMLLWKEDLGDYTIPLDTSSNIHWFLLLKFAKASKRFYRPCGLSGLCTGPMKWPQRCVAAYVVTLATGKGKGKGKGVSIRTKWIISTLSVVRYFFNVACQKL